MEILGILVLVTLSGITTIALITALNLLIPVPIALTRQILENSPGRSLLLGAVNFIFFALLFAGLIWLSQNTLKSIGGVFIFLAVVILLGIVITSLIGLAAFSMLLGERISGGVTPFISYLRGGTLMVLAGLAPYVGWFLFTPLVLWTGMGAAISATLRRRQAPPTLDSEA